LKEKLINDDEYIGYTGLQLQGKDQWYDVCVPKDCFIINLGDLLASMTNYKWRSTNHRVNIPNKDNNYENKHTDILRRPVFYKDNNYRRLSMAYFQNLNSDVIFENLNGDKSEKLLK